MEAGLAVTQAAFAPESSILSRSTKEQRKLGFDL
jgi:hypothetical protein